MFKVIIETHMRRYLVGLEALNCGLSFHLLPYVVYASREGSDEPSIYAGSSEHSIVRVRYKYQHLVLYYIALM